jgi:hypothetical protein
VVAEAKILAVEVEVVHIFLHLVAPVVRVLQLFVIPTHLRLQL